MKNKNRTICIASDPLAGSVPEFSIPAGVEFTQYLMPDGRTQQQWIKLDAKAEALAEKIKLKGYRFEMEMLSDMRTCSFTIHDPQKGEDVAIKLCQNGPDVIKAVNLLISDFSDAIEL